MSSSKNVDKPISLKEAYSSLDALSMNSLGGANKGGADKDGVSIQSTDTPFQYIAVKQLDAPSKKHGVVSSVESKNDINGVETFGDRKHGKGDVALKPVVVDNGAPIKDHFITKFYMGSITVVGLYIFYRMLVKNR